MKILVTTPTGRVGSRVTRLLVQAGVRPVVLVRDAKRLAADLREQCEVVEADQTDGDAVVAATVGVDALYWVNPPPAGDDPIAGHARFGAVAARAVMENGISRVVFQSSGGAEAREGFGEIDGLATTEVFLDGTDAHVTHLRCGYFFTNLLLDVDSVASGTITTTLPLDHRMPWVDPRDIGDVAAARLLATDWHGRHTLGVHGPADLSFTEVAEILTAALGRTVTAERLPEETVARFLRQNGFTEAQTEAMIGMTRGLPEFKPENPRTIATTTPTTLEGWAFATLRPALER
ncbi:NAD(P)H-binding protein [Stackebrandtia soli]|uniref:NmrA family NAD(P)-binding protein n=1 Tax=Stackebrandtia soli TaxID=1892856 RepID=UPI0039EC06A2